MENALAACKADAFGRVYQTCVADEEALARRVCRDAAEAAFRRGPLFGKINAAAAAAVILSAEQRCVRDLMSTGETYLSKNTGFGAPGYKFCADERMRAYSRCNDKYSPIAMCGGR